MAKKNRLSHDQKRKAKLAKEARRARQDMSPLAYDGKKYKTDALVPVFLATETGVYESFIMTDRKLTDRMVRGAYETLILQLRQGPLPPEETGTIQVVAGHEEELVIQNIRRNWENLAPRPSTDNLIGVLRTLLHSVQVWSSRSAESRGYLHYLEGFLKRGGVSVNVVSDEGEMLDEPDEPELLTIGRAWCEDDDRDARDAFYKMAQDMIREGEGETVVNVCQELAGGLDRGITQNELLAMSLTAQRAPGQG
jgi:hypothetical protein